MGEGEQHEYRKIFFSSDLIVIVSYVMALTKRSFQSLYTMCLIITLHIFLASLDFL